MCVPWELNPQPFVLLTQCSTTEPQEHKIYCIRNISDYFLIIINVENSCDASHFCEKLWYLFLRFFDEQKEQHLFEIISCNSINVFTVTFDQFNASLLKKSTNSFKNDYWPQMFEWYNFCKMYKFGNDFVNISINVFSLQT